ncbi:MAG: flagellar protein FlgN [Firmicutes bacterium]|nr:flagellar protein FlgN [Bacillota bacterium]
MSEKKSLQTLLQQEIDVLKELNNLSLSKKEVLLKDDLDALQVIVLKEEALSTQLKILDDACSPQVQFFLKERFSKDETGVKKPSEQIVTLIEELRQQTLQLKLNNEFNQALIKDALAIVEFTINALMPQTSAESGLYGASGKVNQDKKNSKKTLILDYKG